MAKLNFWQWLGVVLLIVGVVLLIMRETGKEEAKPLPVTQPAPAVPAATNPG